jgi:hypothetical protein
MAACQAAMLARARPVVHMGKVGMGEHLSATEPVRLPPEMGMDLHQVGGPPSCQAIRLKNNQCRKPSS